MLVLSPYNPWDRGILNAIHLKPLNLVYLGHLHPFFHDAFSFLPPVFGRRPSNQTTAKCGDSNCGKSTQRVQVLCGVCHTRWTQNPVINGVHMGPLPWAPKPKMVKSHSVFRVFLLVHIACLLFLVEFPNMMKKHTNTHYSALFNFCLYQIYLNKAFKCFVYARTRLRVEIGETFCIKQLAQLGTFFAEAVPERIAFSNEASPSVSHHRMSCAKIPKLQCTDQKPRNWLLTWRIIPGCSRSKWPFMAYKWGILTTYKSWDDPPST